MQIDTTFPQGRGSWLYQIEQNLHVCQLHYLSDKAGGYATNNTSFSIEVQNFFLQHYTKRLMFYLYMSQIKNELSQGTSPMQAAWVCSLVGELRCHMLHNSAKQMRYLRFVYHCFIVPRFFNELVNNWPQSLEKESLRYSRFSFTRWKDSKKGFNIS